MAKRTLLLLQTERLRDQLSESAYKFYIKEYRLEVNVNLFLTAYNIILTNI